MRRRHLTVGVVLAVAFVLGLAAVRAWTGTSTAADPDADRIRPRAFEVHVDTSGIRFGTRVRFTGDVTLRSPTLRAGDTGAKASLWPEDDADHDGEDRDPLFLPRGTRVLLEGTVRPDCQDPDPAGAVAFSVWVSVGDGPERAREIRADEADLLTPAAQRWCALDPHASVSRSTVWRDGDALVRLTVTNPGSDAIEVEVPAYSNPRVSWAAASATVPAGGDAVLRIRGTDVDCRPDEETSWQEGRLLVDGTPLVVSSDNSWC
jgi:hypothetical protein